VLAWEANDRLRSHAKTLKKTSNNLADEGVLRLQLYKDKIVKIREDNSIAVKWTGFVKSILLEIEAEKVKFEEINMIKTNTYQHRDNCITSFEDEINKTIFLRESIVEG
jgi:hypothetical protein